MARDTILQRAEQLKSDPELLSLDQQLAVLKAVFERYMEHYNLQIEDYESFLERLKEADDEDDTARLIQETFPVMDLSIVKEIANVAYKSFDMHYSKRYSVPIEEMAEMLNGIIGAFTTVAEKYGLPNEARAEFAAEVRAIRSQKMVATTAGNGKKQLILDGGRD